MHLARFPTAADHKHHALHRSQLSDCEDHASEVGTGVVFTMAQQK